MNIFVYLSLLWIVRLQNVYENLEGEIVSNLTLYEYFCLMSIS